jgi:hypothetical protein
MALDFTEQVAALFTRFADRYGLRYTTIDAPVELLWEFPIQPKLSHLIVLGLQNNDELNFGVGDFWSYFFPFEEKQIEFEKIIDKWVEGAARIVPKPGILIQGQELQTLENGAWNTAYAARSLSWRKCPSAILTNTISQ